MKRETVFAIVLGILLGLGIGLFVLFKSGNGEETKVIPLSGDSNTNKVVTTKTTDNQVILEVQEPKDNVVTSKNAITIKGKAKINSLIVIQSQINNEIVKNEKEDFSVDFPLAVGENVISINAYTESSTPQELSLKVYYVKE